jgi:predicted metal-dependent hydrolase
MRETRGIARRSAKALSIPGVEAPVEVRRHPAARRMTLRVSRTHRAVILTLPMRCDLSAVDIFVNRHAEWVRMKLGNLPGPVPFALGAVVPYRGEAHEIVGRAARGAGVVVREERPGSRPLLRVAGEAEHLPRRLTDWFIEQARRDLDLRVAVHCRTLGVRAKRITVRDQLSRWGSCSSTGSLSFSWRLILAPPEVLDYVAAHEVAHLREMNHSKRFWSLVRQAMPEMDAARTWLYTHGTDLHRYGAVS